MDKQLFFYSNLEHFVPVFSGNENGFGFWIIGNSVKYIKFSVLCNFCFKFSQVNYRLHSSRLGDLPTMGRTCTKVTELRNFGY